MTITLVAGAHTVVLTRIGYETWQQTVQVVDGEQREVRAALVRPQGTLVVEGAPAGSTVWIDGVPAEGPVQARGGGVNVRVDVPGQPSVEIGAPVTGGAKTTVTYEEARRDPWRLGIAVVGPGSLQLTDGRPVIGALVLATITGSAALAILRQGDYSAIRREHTVAADAYLSAESEAEVTEALALLDEIDARGVGVRQVQHRALLVGLAAYTLGAIDGLIHHTKRPRLRFSDPQLPTVSADGAGVRLTVSL